MKRSGLHREIPRRMGQWVHRQRDKNTDWNAVGDFSSQLTQHPRARCPDKPGEFFLNVAISNLSHHRETGMQESPGSIESEGIVMSVITAQLALQSCA